MSRHRRAQAGHDVLWRIPASGLRARSTNVIFPKPRTETSTGKVHGTSVLKVAARVSRVTGGLRSWAES